LRKYSENTQSLKFYYSQITDVITHHGSETVGTKLIIITFIIITKFSKGRHWEYQYNKHNANFHHRRMLCHKLHF